MNPEAASHFLSYEDKTGNKWKPGKKFVKKPGKFYPVEIDYNTDSSEPKLLDVSKATGSKLPARTQSLISLMFDIEHMKNTLIELEVDVKKMPLGMYSSSPTYFRQTDQNSNQRGLPVSYRYSESYRGKRWSKKTCKEVAGSYKSVLYIGRKNQQVLLNFLSDSSRFWKQETSFDRQRGVVEGEVAAVADSGRN